MCIIFPMIVILAIVVNVGEAVGHTNQNHVLHNLDSHGVGQIPLQQAVQLHFNYTCKSMF